MIWNISNGSSILYFVGYSLAGHRGGCQFILFTNMLVYLDNEIDFWIIARGWDLKRGQEGY